MKTDEKATNGDNGIKGHHAQGVRLMESDIGRQGGWSYFNGIGHLLQSYIRAHFSPLRLKPEVIYR